MTSSINPQVPIVGTPTTASVRANFAAAKAEIEALQALAVVQGTMLPHLADDTLASYAHAYSFRRGQYFKIGKLLVYTFAFKITGKAAITGNLTLSLTSAVSLDLTVGGLIGAGSLITDGFTNSVGFTSFALAQDPGISGAPSIKLRIMETGSGQTYQPAPASCAGAQPGLSGFAIGILA